jgi:aspartyl protease family protein
VNTDSFTLRGRDTLHGRPVSGVASISTHMKGMGVPGDSIANLIYLLLLLLFVGGWLARGRFEGRSQAFRHAGSWIVIFAVAVLAAALWDDIRRDVPQQAFVEEDGAIAVPRASDGHYYLIAEVEGEPVRFLIDTGATDVVLTRVDAERVGIDTADLLFSGRAGTANGEVRTAPVWLGSFRIGPIGDRDVRAHVNEGQMSTSLLGMSYLRRYGRIEIAGNRLILER